MRSGYDVSCKKEMFVEMIAHPHHKGNLCKESAANQIEV